MKPSQSMPDAPCECCPFCFHGIDLVGGSLAFRIICKRTRVVLYRWYFNTTSWQPTLDLAAYQAGFV